MQVHLYKTNSEFLLSVELEVVPSGTYVVNGVEYNLVGKPIFYIITDEQTGKASLNHVKLFLYPSK